jgi:hypothetical protein
MTQEQLTQLTRIFNTLLNVHTCGEDTLIMSDCVRALQQIIVEENKKNEEENKPVEE